MLSKTALLAAVILTGCIIMGLAFNSVRMAPVKEGSTIDFWYLTCGVDTGSNYVGCLTGGNYAKLWGDYILFSQSHQHGSDLVKVRSNDIVASFPAIIALLEERTRSDDPNDIISQTYRKWKADVHEPPRIQDVQTLVAAIEMDRKSHYYKNNPDNAENFAEWNALERYDFERRLRQVKWYWASILFELIWLVGLVWFTAWPIIRKMRCWHVIIRLGFMPIGLFLPMFMGYAQYTFTSCFPGGGILYPFILIRFKGGSMNNWDETILEYLPQIFEPLSQGIGTPLAVTGFGAPGPTSILLAGLAISLIITGVITLTRLFRKRTL